MRIIFPTYIRAANLDEFWEWRDTHKLHTWAKISPKLSLKGTHTLRLIMRQDTGDISLCSNTRVHTYTEENMAGNEDNFPTYIWAANINEVPEWRDAYQLHTWAKISTKLSLETTQTLRLMRQDTGDISLYAAIHVYIPA